jgi:dTDP-4-amino-4,6-dideoxygalactose transaminase
MQVPFIDLKRQYDPIKKDINERYSVILGSQNFIQGANVQEFEKRFARYCGSKYCVAVNSGTSALYLALMANGIGYKDEVITVPNSFIATAEAISLCGGVPVFVDIDEKTYNIDVDKIETAITDKTKAIIPVHLYGQCADMDSINEIAERYDIKVIEDACQAHGAEYKAKKTGSLGHIAAFSFYPSKNLGAFGEGGAVITNNDDLAEKITLLRDHGSREKYLHSIIGGNFRMEETQGMVLSIKLRFLDKWNDMRRNAARIYDELLTNLDVITPYETPYCKHVYHLYVVRVKNREGVIGHLTKQGIGTGIHYPIPIHLQEAYRFMGLKTGSFPNAETVANEILSLPMFPYIREDEIEYVAKEIEEGVSNNPGEP